uniref:hypothetical protein n=1 Tax=Conchiformibius steedae TaxID=153493 RepID=UPI0026EC29D1
SLLEAGMPLLDRNGSSGSLKVKSQMKLERWETVYNLEVEDYATYHIGLFGVWVHNECCNVNVNGTIHGQQRLAERGFTQEKVNNIVQSYSEKGYQPGGLTVYIKKKHDGSYDVIILNNKNELVTAVGGNESKRNLPNRATVMRMLNNNGGFSGVPID